MMAATDIIGFSFFIILPGCLPDLLSLVTVDRFILPTFSHTHTRAPPPPVAHHHHRAVRPFRLFFRRNPRPVRAASSRERSPAFHLVLLSLARAKLLLLVSIWYGCSLHFFGSFVIDRGCLNYSTAEREEWLSEESRKG